MPSKDYAGVMQTLKSEGTAQNVKVYKRHGAGEELFGVSFANIKKLRKEIKTDHELAIKLWASKNIDARVLATMVADPKKFTEKDIDSWINDISYYVLLDEFVKNIVYTSDFAKLLMEKWTKENEEWIGRAGWVLVALFAINDKTLPDPYFEKYLVGIQNNIKTGKNRKKEAMNNALIAIGMRNDSLKKKALEVASKIGKVNVDHGETSCKTPDATSYINKPRRKK